MACTSHSYQFASILLYVRMKQLPYLQMQIGPPDPAFFICEDVCCAKIETDPSRLLIKLHGHHVEIEEVSQHYLL